MTQGSAAQQGAASARSRIYRYLYETQAFCSKQALAKHCAISMPTLYQNLSELMDDGLVRYSGERQSTGGRKAQGLDIVPDARVAAGVSVSEDLLRLTVVDLRLNELAYQAGPFDLAAALSDRSAVLSGILEKFLDDAGVERSKLLGVGVTIPGLLSPDHSRIAFAPTLGLRDVPLRDLTRGIDYPVLVDNDASASGHAECYVRDGQRNMAYLFLENGVGGAVLIDGKPYAGSGGSSGEFGHICVEPGGLRCACGKFGCLEAYCSPRRIEKTFGVTAEEFFQGVEAHNAEYESLLYDMLRHIALAINSIRMSLDCDVVLGGFFSEFLRPYLPVLRRYVEACNPFGESADFVQLSTLRRHVAPLGAALSFVREFVNGV